jgi:hypothetical protein
MDLQVRVNDNGTVSVVDDAINDVTPDVSLHVLLVVPSAPTDEETTRVEVLEVSLHDDVVSGLVAVLVKINVDGVSLAVAGSKNVSKGP